MIHDDMCSKVILNNNQSASDSAFDDDSNKVVVPKYDSGIDRVLINNGSDVNINIKQQCNNKQWEI